jgi:CheY-like chemotaxis protein/HPt (histidine-containing phosphotransfer) domain-containing protein
VAGNGKEALKAFSENRYDLILMDCEMPEMDGYEATRSIREEQRLTQPGHPHVPIIALTANAFKEDRERCLAAGMDDYLSKPFTQGQLAEALERWLNKKPATQEGGHRAEDSGGRASSDAEAHRSSVDRKALDAIRALQRQGKPDLLAKVINVYLEDSLRLVEGLRQAVSQGDAENVRRRAHSLKSSSANVGAVRLSALCKDLEKANPVYSAEQIDRMVTRIEEEYTSVREDLMCEW